MKEGEAKVILEELACKQKCMEKAH